MRAFARLARVYPGNWSYAELLELDYRDFLSWLRESQRTLTAERLERLTEARLGAADMEGKAFRDEADRLTWELKLMAREDEEE